MTTKPTHVSRKLLKITNAALAIAVATTFLAAVPAQAAGPLVVIEPSGTATCSQTNADCIAAVSLTGNARCEKATCVAVSGTGKAESGCWGTQCMDCEDSSCGFTECSGDFAVTCVAIAVSGNEASSGAYCHWFTQTCWAVAVSPWRTTLYYCYGDLYDDYDCSGQA